MQYIHIRGRRLWRLTAATKRLSVPDATLRLPSFVPACVPCSTMCTCAPTHPSNAHDAHGAVRGTTCCDSETLALPRSSCANTSSSMQAFLPRQKRCSSTAECHISNQHLPTPHCAARRRPGGVSWIDTGARWCFQTVCVRSKCVVVVVTGRQAAACNSPLPLGGRRRLILLPLLLAASNAKLCFRPPLNFPLRPSSCLPGQVSPYWWRHIEESVQLSQQATPPLVLPPDRCGGLDCWCGGVPSNHRNRKPVQLQPWGHIYHACVRHAVPVVLARGTQGTQALPSPCVVLRPAFLACRLGMSVLHTYTKHLHMAANSHTGRLCL